MLQDGIYTADEDINQTLGDGRTILLLAKGQSISEAEALRLKFIKRPQVQVGPTEFKAPGQTPGQQVNLGDTSAAAGAGAGVTTTHTITAFSDDLGNDLKNDAGSVLAGPSLVGGAVTPKDGELVTGEPVTGAAPVADPAAALVDEIKPADSVPVAVGSQVNNPRALGRASRTSPRSSRSS